MVKNFPLCISFYIDINQSPYTAQAVVRAAAEAAMAQFEPGARSILEDTVVDDLLTGASSRQRLLAKY